MSRKFSHYLSLITTEIQQNYHQGDRVILVGRLSMNTVERQEGFKEKHAELTVQQIQSGC